MNSSKMKVAFVALIAANLSLASCGNKSSQKPTESAPAATEQTAANYACPMHPEVTGKKGDTCRICGMELEPVTKADAGDKKMEMK